jgi:hypothetical protein
MISAAAGSISMRGGLPVGSAEHVAELAGIEHLDDDVTAADQLPVHIELRDGRPVAIDLDAVAQLGVLQHVDRLVVRQHHVEGCHGLGREAALGLGGVALHEEHHAVVAEEGVDGFAGFCVHEKYRA